MKSPRVKQLLLEELKKKPVVEVACAKVGVGRTTFYEWKQKDKKFAEAIDMAMRFGKDFISDIAEMQLLNAIKSGDFRAVSMWLKTHRQEYRNRIEVDGTITTIEEMTAEQRALFERATALMDPVPKL
jgi:hypothetical protein